MNKMVPHETLTERAPTTTEQLIESGRNERTIALRQFAGWARGIFARRHRQIASGYAARP